MAKMHASLQAVGMAPAAWAPYLLHLLGGKAETEDLASVPPETLKAKTFEALQHLLLHRSRQQPLLLAVEDLQWLDQTSEAFLGSLVERLGGRAHPSSGDLSARVSPALAGEVLRDPARGAAAGVPGESARVVQAALQTAPVSDHLVREIVAKAEGNPFFLEEMAQTLLEHGGSALQLPATVQGVLAARAAAVNAMTRLLFDILTAEEAFLPSVSGKLRCPAALPGVADPVTARSIRGTDSREDSCRGQRMHGRAIQFSVLGSVPPPLQRGSKRTTE